MLIDEKLKLYCMDAIQICLNLGHWPYVNLGSPSGDGRNTIRGQVVAKLGNPVCDNTTCLVVLCNGAKEEYPVNWMLAYDCEFCKVSYPNGIPLSFP